MSQYFNKNILIYGRQRRHCHLISPTRHECMAHRLWNAIFTSLIIKKSMLLIHYISIMMQIFYIDWQQHWECVRTMNIGANAHGEQTVSTKPENSHKWQTWPPLTVGLPVTSERYWAGFQITRLFHEATVSQCDHFFAATYVFIVWNFTRLITRLKRFFFFFFLTSI